MNKLAWNPLSLWKPVTSALGRATVNNPNKVIKWTSRIAKPLVGGGAFFGGAGYLQGRMQGQQTMTGIGNDAAEAMIAKQMQGMPSWQRELVALDPSLAMVVGDRAAPGLIKNYEQQSGQAFKPGLIGSLFNQSGEPTKFVNSNGQALS